MDGPKRSNVALYKEPWQPIGFEVEIAFTLASTLKQTKIDPQDASPPLVVALNVRAHLNKQIWP